ncbi:MAG: hypothetical protein IPL43_13660 [Micropruina sp.]|nr:hypothetical protein [Micropruina sp.]
MLVDVEVGSLRALYALAMGEGPYADEPGKDGFPAAPNTGLLMRADDQGTTNRRQLQVDLRVEAPNQSGIKEAGPS